MRAGPAPLLVVAALAACTRPPVDRPVEVLLPRVSASPPPEPPPSAASARRPAPPPPADPGWKQRCAAFVEAGLAAAAAREPSLGRVEVEVEERDALGTRGPLGFHIQVARAPREPDAEPPPGIWQHRAESLAGSYHIVFIKQRGDVTAWLGFDGWPSPRVQPLVPGLQAALDRCFPPG